MNRLIPFLFFIFSTNLVLGQIDVNSLISLPLATTTILNNIISPAIRGLSFDTNRKRFFEFTSSGCNDISRCTKVANCFGVRYGSQNGDNLVVISDSLTFNTSEFSINVSKTSVASSKSLVSLFTNYKSPPIMKNLCILLFFAFYDIAFTQIDANSVMGIPSASNDTEMNGITGANEGSMVYNASKKNIYLFDGTDWVPVNKDKNTIGDIKYSSQTADHVGWYLLNGRLTSTLSSNAQTNASSLGFTTNLPNAENRVLKHPNIGESIGDIGGQATTTLTRANLPNVNFTGNTSTNGNHSHTINRGVGTDQVRHNSDANRTFFNQGGTTTTSTTGNHNHTVTVSSGGSDQPFQRYQPYIVFNTFIYLDL